MSSSPRVFYNHSRHTLEINNLQAPIDVLTFDGVEGLSQPFLYTIEFTSAEQDISVEQVLNQRAWFSLHAPPVKNLVFFQTPVSTLLRTFYGVITGFQRLSASRDEARYSVTLQPRLALAGRGKQSRIYQQQSVPEIVKSILLGRHDMEHFDCPFHLVREYPRREQVMQYDESDLDFIHRLLAEVGIWYRIGCHPTTGHDVVEFHDEQKGYQFDIELPYRGLTGLSSGDQDSVWNLQTRHQVVEKHITFRSYKPLDARAYLDGDVNQVRNDKTTSGEAFYYGLPYSELGNKLYQFESLASESGYHFARLRHERYLNNRTRLSGSTDSPTLAPGQVLNMPEGAPQAFRPGAVITHLRTCAARDASFIAHFEAMPYDHFICFRPPVLPKPQMVGTLPARISSHSAGDTYAYLDGHGYYRVKFLFDRDTWPQGRESRWLRLARPYAGDTYGLHLPLIFGTEVAIAFEEGDPDRPYIAHALHDSDRPDVITDRQRDHSRNVLRTPANNKLRMEDLRGQEHVKLSTEYGGKSQLNLGHLVDAKKQKRGEGVELRTDDWGVIRAGKGVLISADKQTKAIGDVLSMAPATEAIQSARQQIAECREIAQAHHSQTPDMGGLQQLQTDAKDLHGAAILLSAPKGIGAVTPASLLLKSGDGLYVQSADEINLAAAQRLSIHANQGMSLLAQQEGMRLVSGKGPLQIESHGDLLDLIAQQDLTLQSAQGHVQVTAKNGITLGCGGAYIRITSEGEIQLHSPGLISFNGLHRFSLPSGAAFPLSELPSSVCKECLRKARAKAQGFTGREARG
ncbi:type VI secretion system Vgr family protein [Pseudomonas fluorescens]|uniref:type VI secretion system Vgr family protein n=1 Tax=Pseudomonas fluorescens TaxID=294 RepID=UPI003F9BB353